MIFTEDDIKAAVKCAREFCINLHGNAERLDVLNDEDFYIKVLEHASSKAVTAIVRVTENVGGYDKEFKSDLP